MGKGKGRNRRDNNANRQLNYAVYGETIYGQVDMVCGSGRFLIICSDTVKRTCTIKGSVRNKVWINRGDIVLVNLIEGSPDKGLILQKYFDHEISALKKKNEIPDAFEAAENIEAGIEFDWQNL